MISVFELGYRYVLPALKRRLAQLLLKEHGFEQVEIARILGISPSAVSRYLSAQRGGVVDVTRFSDVDAALRALAAKIARGDVDAYGLQLRLAQVALYMMSRKYLCSYHAEIDPGIDPAKCKICPELFRGIELP